MTGTILHGARLAGVTSAVPKDTFDNVRDTAHFDPVDVKKVVAMAGVKSRKVTDGSLCSTDLCLAAAQNLLTGLDWSADSIDALIFVTQTPDYFLPSSSCLAHRDLKLSERCAVFDVGLGCSGYPYGVWLANMMVQTSSAKRVLVLHGDTPSRITHKEDRSTFLLFGDGGTATAIEATDQPSDWGYCLFTDGNGYSDLIIPGGGYRNPKPENERDYYVYMNGANLFNFTVTKVPELIDATFGLMNKTVEGTDLFFFHQSNQFIMKHIAKKCQIPSEKVPIILGEFGNIGGASVPLTMTQYLLKHPLIETKTAMLLGYGVGLSWGSAYITLDERTYSHHQEVESLK